MRLEERLNKALSSKALLVQHIPLRTTSSKPNTHSTFSTLDEAIEQAHLIQIDEDGLQICNINSIDTKSMNLPSKIGKYIIEDIQPLSTGGYEVHLTKNKN